MPGRRIVSLLETNTLLVAPTYASGGNINLPQAYELQRWRTLAAPAKVAEAGEPRPLPEGGSKPRTAAIQVPRKPVATRARPSARPGTQSRRQQVASRARARSGRSHGSYGHGDQGAPGAAPGRRPRAAPNAFGVTSPPFRRKGLAHDRQPALEGQALRQGRNKLRRFGWRHWFFPLSPPAHRRYSAPLTRMHCTAGKALEQRHPLARLDAIKPRPLRGGQPRLSRPRNLSASRSARRS